MGTGVFVDVSGLPTTISNGLTGHNENHVTIHKALQSYANVATSGSASDLQAGTLPVSRLDPSVGLIVKYSGTAWPARPTDNPAVSVLWLSASSVAPPPIVASGTGGMYEGDRLGTYT